jgi:hypothetical protein
LVAPNHGPASFHDFLHAHNEIWDRATHLAVHEDLVNHIWIHAGNNPITNLGNNPVWFYLYYILLCCKIFIFIWLKTICNVPWNNLDFYCDLFFKKL